MAGHSPCGACKLLRRRCTDCIFAPYFPSDDLQKFEIVHKVFGAGKVSKWLQNFSEEKRAAVVSILVDIANAVSSLINEGNVRVEDPVHGCAGVISLTASLVAELEAARGLCHMSQARIPCIQNHEAVQGGKGEEAFETPSGVAAGETAEPSDAAVKRMRPTIDLNKPPSDAAVKRMRPTIDLNKPPSDEDEDIKP